MFDILTIDEKKRDFIDQRRKNRLFVVKRER